MKGMIIIKVQAAVYVSLLVVHLKDEPKYSDVSEATS